MFDLFKIMINARLAKMEERGASAVEYGLLIAGIAALIVVAVFALGPIVKEAFTDTCAAIKTGNASLSGTCDLISSGCRALVACQGGQGPYAHPKGRPP